MMNGLRHIDYIIVIVLYLLLSAGLRWGLPSSERSSLYDSDRSRLVGRSSERLFVTGPLQSYQVDECSTLLPLARMNPRKFDFDPEWYHWGSLYLYMVGGALGVAALTGIITLTPDRMFYLANPEALGRIYLIARIVTWTFGLGCIILFITLLRQRSPSALLRSLAGMVFVTAPLFVLYSHYATPDITLLFWFMLALSAAGDARNRPSSRMLLISFAAAGLATSTKYYGILALGFPLWDSLRDRQLSITIKGLLISAAAFFVGTPYAILNVRGFIHDLHWQMNHVQVGHGDIFLGTLPSFSHHLLESFPAGISTPATLLIILTTVLGIVRFRRIRTPATILVIILLWIQLSRSPLKFSRYILPLIPLHLVLGFEVIHEVWVRKTLRFLLLVLIGISVVSQLIVSARHVSILITPDIRDRAGVWLAENSQEGDTVLLPGRPYFATPPMRSDQLHIIISEFDSESIRHTAPDWIIISDYDAEPWMRAPHIREMEFQLFHQLRSELPLSDGSRYTSHEFRTWSWPGTALDGAGFLPHDMRYHCPTLWIFQREPGGTIPKRRYSE